MVPGLTSKNCLATPLDVIKLIYKKKKKELAKKSNLV